MSLCPWIISIGTFIWCINSKLLKQSGTNLEKNLVLTSSAADLIDLKGENNISPLVGLWAAMWHAGAVPIDRPKIIILFVSKPKFLTAKLYTYSESTVTY